MTLTLSWLEDDGRTVKDTGIEVGAVNRLDLDLKVEVCSTVQAKSKLPHSVRDFVPGRLN